MSMHFLNCGALRAQACVTCQLSLAQDSWMGCPHPVAVCNGGSIGGMYMHIYIYIYLHSCYKCCLLYRKKQTAMASFSLTAQTFRKCVSQGLGLGLILGDGILQTKTGMIRKLGFRVGLLNAIPSSSVSKSHTKLNSKKIHRSRSARVRPQNKSSNSKPLP